MEPSGGRRHVPWVVAALLVCALVFVVASRFASPRSSWTLEIAVLAVAAALIAATAARSRWMPSVRGWLEDVTDGLDRIPESRLPAAVALASGAALFAELLIIRWHSSAFHLFGFFKNVSLLAAFLGLGIGYAMGRRRPVAIGLVLPGLAAQMVAMQILRFTRLQIALNNPVSEELAIGAEATDSLSSTFVTYTFLGVVFITTALVCVPLGHLPARLMQRLPPLRAYGWNLAGSLGGIAAFALAALLWSPPHVWLLMLAVSVLPFVCLARAGAGVAAGALSVTVAVAALSAPARANVRELHSPYQVITFRPLRDGVTFVEINNSVFQLMADLRPETRGRTEELDRYRAHYELPYTLKPEPERVLIVGSGTGNDVAGALRCGARHVDAVEIDPAFVELGRTLHAERPYRDARVRTIIDDARHFMRTTDARYDVIMYGTLDSHVLASGHTNVRLDSFVYTIEAFREARRRLKPGGIVVLAFATVNYEMNVKLFRMLKEAFDGKSPRMVGETIGWGATFLAGDGVPDPLPPALASRDKTADYETSPLRTDASTDDWPFLYMPRRAYPVTYLVMIAFLLVVSTVVVRDFMSMAPDRNAALFFLLGAGFMLVETKAITELALLYGSTWRVVSVVIVGVLVMAMAANAWVARRRSTTRAWPAFAGIGALLVAGAVLSPGHFAFPGGWLVATALITSPLLCSGVVFSSALKHAGDVGSALSWNLLGAMLGGFLEYNSLYFGFRSLNFLAIGIYAAALLVSLRSARP